MQEYFSPRNMEIVEQGIIKRIDETIKSKKQLEISGHRGRHTLYR